MKFVGDDLTADEMRIYIAGEQDARANYKPRLTAMVGTVVVGGVAFLASGGLILTLVPPLAYAGLQFVPVMRIQEKAITNPQHRYNEIYALGYERVARSRKVLGGLKGGVAGMVIGAAALLPLRTLTFSPSACLGFATLVQSHIWISLGAALLALLTEIECFDEISVAPLVVAFSTLLVYNLLRWVKLKQISSSPSSMQQTGLPAHVHAGLVLLAALGLAFTTRHLSEAGLLILACAALPAIAYGLRIIPSSKDGYRRENCPM